MDNKELAVEVCKCWVGEMIVDRIRKCLEDEDDPMRLDYIDILTKIQSQIQKIKLPQLERA